MREIRIEYNSIWVAVAAWTIVPLIFVAFVWREPGEWLGHLTYLWFCAGVVFDRLAIVLGDQFGKWVNGTNAN